MGELEGNILICQALGELEVKLFTIYILLFIII
jgi:hypothetical protein